MSRTTWPPPGAAATDDHAYDDRFPTQPIAVARHQHREPAGGAAPSPRSAALIAVALVIAAVTAALGHQTWTSWSPSASSARSAPAASPVVPDPQADDVPRRPLRSARTVPATAVVASARPTAPSPTA